MDLKNSAVFAAYNNASNITNNPAGMTNNAGGADFGKMVNNTVQDTASTLHSAESISQASLVDNVSLEELAAAVNNAEMTLKTVVAVRDRIINAYQDIIKMPI